MNVPNIKTERLSIKLLEPSEAGLMTEFRNMNKQHLTRWEPTRSLEFYTEGFWRMQLRFAIRDFRNGESVCLTILNRSESQVIGVCNYTNIVRGTFQSCHLGYALDVSHEGQGLMCEALESANRYIFSELKLHRIMANYIPGNVRSAGLLRRLGFIEEGRASSYLKINGRWEDHILTSLINPKDI